MAIGSRRVSNWLNRGGLALVIISCLSAAPCRAQSCEDWQPGEPVPGVDGYVVSLARWDPDGDGPQDEWLIAGGQFRAAGGVAALNIAAWDGEQWHSLGSGLSSTVAAIAVFNGDLIVGGAFEYSGETPVNFIARWDGDEWNPLGAGTDSNVVDLAVYNDQLIVGGYFTLAGGALARGLARWDGASWSEFEGGVSPFPCTTCLAGVLALQVHGGSLFVGGGFGLAGGIQARNIARWNGSTWSPMFGGVNNAVHAFASHEGDLIVGGAFSQAGGVPCVAVARWDGLNWSPLGTGLTGKNEIVQALHSDESGLFAGGGFSDYSPAIHFVARWDGDA